MPQASTTTPKIAFIGLGANQGDSPATLAKAVAAIAALPGLELVAASSLYTTQPQENRDQPWFVNQVIAVSYDETWNELQLYSHLARIEAELGRKRVPGEARFGPRPIDLDLFLFGGQVLDSPELTLPHPRMKNRAFVLVPLAEIAPDLVFPDGERLRDALAKIAFQADGNVIRQD